MKIERTKNATRNIIFGVIQKIYMLFIPFIMRTIMIYFLGVEYLGLNSLFTSVLQVLNLAELGVGNAMIYSMYKPIAEDDKSTICALMNLYRKYYRYIGLFIAVIGFILVPFLPFLIEGSIPSDINIYVIYILNLSATVFSYWLFAYKNSLFDAHQRNDIVNKINIIVVTVQYILQIFALSVLKNYYLYLVLALIFQIIINIITALIAKKMFPDYTPNGKLRENKIKEINKSIQDLFTAKLGGTIVNSADTLVISAFLGLSMLAIYQNYFYIMNSVIGFFTIIFTSCTAGIGNSLVVETKEKNYYDFKKLAFLIIWIATICISCFLCLYQPFMTVWVGSQYLLDMKVVILLCVYFYLYLINNLSCVYKDAAGIWHKDRFRPLISGVTNLIMNIIMVRYIGIYGVILSTIFSYLFIAMPWVIHNLFSLVFFKSPKEYIFIILKGASISVVISSICYLLCNMVKLSSILQIIYNFSVCIFFSNIFLILIYRKNPMFVSMTEIFDNITNFKFHYFINIINNLCKGEKNV